MYLLSFLNGGLLHLHAWQLVLVTLALTHVTIASVTIFLHRSQAHRALDLHPAVSHFFRLWLWMTTGMLTGEWVAIHRKHHAKCETPEDPHSPQTRGLKTVLLSGAELYIAESANQETLARFSHGTPRDWLERNVYSQFTWQGVGLMLVIDLILFGVAGLSVWAVQMIWIPFFAAGVINGVGHFYGYRNYQCRDASTNISPWGILIGGEELHNNHHAHPTSARLSAKWFEFDLGWTYICILQALGLAKVLRVAPVPRTAPPAKLIDFDTLQAVVANRYDLLARFSGELQRALRAELSRQELTADQRSRFRRLAGWFKRGDGRPLTDAEQRSLQDLRAASGLMNTLVEMRAELTATWERSSSSREQMLAHLQDWINRAEASGIAGLQRAAMRIRSYKPGAAGAGA